MPWIDSSAGSSTRAALRSRLWTANWRLRSAFPAPATDLPGTLVELEPITVDSVRWWGEASAGLAKQDSLDNDRWAGASYAVLARYDTSQHVAHLFLTDTSAHEWPFGAALGPLRRIDWLDHPPPSDT